MPKAYLIGIGASIRIVQESWCLPYERFLLSYYTQADLGRGPKGHQNTIIGSTVAAFSFFTLAYIVSGIFNRPGVAGAVLLTAS